MGKLNMGVGGGRKHADYPNSNKMFMAGYRQVTGVALRKVKTTSTDFDVGLVHMGASIATVEKTHAPELHAARRVGNEYCAVPGGERYMPYAALSFTKDYYIELHKDKQSEFSETIMFSRANAVFCALEHDLVIDLSAGPYMIMLDPRRVAHAASATRADAETKLRHGVQGVGLATLRARDAAGGVG
jgi:hypothetical protein